MNPISYYQQRRIQQGDIKEFERLFERYYAPLCHHADRYLKDMNASEDLVQEFFYRLWKNRSDFSPKRSLNAYLYQAIRNNALHYLEHLSVRKSYADHVQREANDEGAEEMGSTAELNDLGRLIHETLGRLPERCAHVFRLNRFEGMKYQEIATMLAISVKTVESDMGKALELFRRTLKDYTREGVL